MSREKFQHALTTWTRHGHLNKEFTIFINRLLPHTTYLKRESVCVKSEMHAGKCLHDNFLHETSTRSFKPGLIRGALIGGKRRGREEGEDETMTNKPHAKPEFTDLSRGEERHRTTYIYTHTR